MGVQFNKNANSNRKETSNGKAKSSNASQKKHRAINWIIRKGQRTQNSPKRLKGK